MQLVNREINIEGVKSLGEKQRRRNESHCENNKFPTRISSNSQHKTLNRLEAAVQLEVCGLLFS